jgi:hypothetical protein
MQGNNQGPWSGNGHAAPGFEQKKPNGHHYKPGQGPAGLSFLDPWADPEPPTWPPDVLPAKYHDMVFERSMAAGLDPGAQGIAALCAISGAAPKNARFHPYGKDGDWAVPPIIWGMIVQLSGQRKSALDGPFEALKREHAKLWQAYYARLLRWRELSPADQRKTTKPVEPHAFVINDATPEAVQIILSRTNRGSLLLRDELAGLFGFGRYAKDKGTAERAFYLESYEGGPYAVSRATKDGMFIAVNGLTIFGRIQPERLKDFADLQDDGLLQRFIMVRAARAAVGRPMGAITGKADFDEAIDLLAKTRGRDYRTTQEGGDVIRRMEADAIEFSAFTGHGPGFSGFCGKLHGTLARLALILHMLKQPDPDMTMIHPDTVLQAERLVHEFVYPHVRDFYATLRPDPVNLTCDIAAWLLTDAPHQLRASDFGKYVWACRGLTGKALNDVLDPLVTGGWLEPDTNVGLNRRWMLNLNVRTYMAGRVMLASERRKELQRLLDRIG